MADKTYRPGDSPRRHEEICAYREKGKEYACDCKLSQGVRRKGIDAVTSKETVKNDDELDL